MRIYIYIYIYDPVLLASCCRLHSERLATLATDHYLVIAVLQLEAPEKREGKKTIRREVGSVSDANVRGRFALTFKDTIRATVGESDCCGCGTSRKMR